MEKIRGEYDRLIHTELRLLRQKHSAASGATPHRSRRRLHNEHRTSTGPRFAEQFRGSEEKIREQQKCYVARFAGASGEILDIGCGRGEFLEAAKAPGLRHAVSIRVTSPSRCAAPRVWTSSKATCSSILESLADGSLGGAYCAQVVEHLAPAAVPRLGEAAFAKAAIGSTGRDRDAQPRVPGDLRDALLSGSRRTRARFRRRCCASISNQPASAASRSSA